MSIFFLFFSFCFSYITLLQRNFIETEPIVSLHNQMAPKSSVVCTLGVATASFLVSNKYSSSTRNLENSGTYAHRLICGSRSSGTYLMSIKHHLEVQVVTIMWPHRCHELVEPSNRGIKHSSESVIGAPQIDNRGIVGDDLVGA